MGDSKAVAPDAYLLDRRRQQKLRPPPPSPPRRKCFPRASVPFFLLEFVMPLHCARSARHIAAHNLIHHANKPTCSKSALLKNSNVRVLLNTISSTSFSVKPASMLASRISDAYIRRTQPDHRSAASATKRTWIPHIEGTAYAWCG